MPDDWTPAVVHNGINKTGIAIAAEPGEEDGVGMEPELSLAELRSRLTDLESGHEARLASLERRIVELSEAVSGLAVGPPAGPPVLVGGGAGHRTTTTAATTTTTRHRRRNHRHRHLAASGSRHLLRPRRCR